VSSDNRERGEWSESVVAIRRWPRWSREAGGSASNALVVVGNGPRPGGVGLRQGQ